MYKKYFIAIFLFLILFANFNFIYAEDGGFYKKGLSEKTDSWIVGPDSEYPENIRNMEKKNQKNAVKLWYDVQTFWAPLFSVISILMTGVWWIWGDMNVKDTTFKILICIIGITLVPTIIGVFN